MEGYPISSGCADDFTSPPNNYGPNHNPFVYYSDIQNNTARCSRIVNANSQVVNQTRASDKSICWPSLVNNDDLFLNDLNSVTDASNYMFLTANTADDFHDCNDVSLGNAWMQNMIPQILSSTLFGTKRAALFITFDEPDCTFKVTGSPNNCPPHARQLYTVWASNPTTPTTRQLFKSGGFRLSFQQMMEARTICKSSSSKAKFLDALPLYFCQSLEIKLYPQATFMSITRQMSPVSSVES